MGEGIVLYLEKILGFFVVNSFFLYKWEINFYFLELLYGLENLKVGIILEV